MVGGPILNLVLKFPCLHTLRRYLAQYRKDGFDGLKPKPKGRKPLPDTNRIVK